VPGKRRKPYQPQNLVPDARIREMCAWLEMGPDRPESPETVHDIVVALQRLKWHQVRVTPKPRGPKDALTEYLAHVLASLHDRHGWQLAEGALLIAGIFPGMSDSTLLQAHKRLRRSGGLKGADLVTERREVHPAFRASVDINADKIVHAFWYLAVLHFNGLI
jgi:hypothetical protein